MKRGTPLERRTPLRQKRPLRRRGWLLARSADPRRRSRSRARQRRQYGLHGAAIRQLPCVVCKAAPLSCAAHASKTKGAGGLAKDLVPLCLAHEMEWHQVGPKSFDRNHGIRLRDVAAELWTQLGLQVEQEERDAWWAFKRTLRDQVRDQRR